MTASYFDLAFTPAVKAAQAANGSQDIWSRRMSAQPFEGLGQDEAAFIAARDSFYLASVSETGWPYVQHRGGPPGFLKVLAPSTLAFPDFRGNRQYISLGNVAGDDRVALILVDYAARARLKILARMQAVDLSADPGLEAKLDLPGYKGRPERAYVLNVEALDWNCSQHITPRFTAAEIDAGTAPLRPRLTELEAEVERLRDQVAAANQRDA